VRFIDDVNHPALQANIDVSHLCLSHVCAAELRRLKGKAIHVHISDCDGQEARRSSARAAGRGRFLPYLAGAIKELGTRRAASRLMLELFPPSRTRSKDWVAVSLPRDRQADCRRSGCAAKPADPVTEVVRTSGRVGAGHRTLTRISATHRLPASEFSRIQATPHRVTA